MSKVIRLSDKKIEMLEEYRQLEMQSLKCTIESFPESEYLKRDLENTSNKDYEELLTDALSTCLFWMNENLKKMQS